MIKHVYTIELMPHTFALPIHAADEEVSLTSLTVEQLKPGDQIELYAFIGWQKPANWDIGELEIIVRKAPPPGDMLCWDHDTCFAYGNSELECSDESPARGSQTYYLSVRSAASRAVVTGPIVLKATVTG